MPAQRKYPNPPCKGCGSEITKPQGKRRVKQLFCSHECYSAWRRSQMTQGVSGTKKCGKCKEVKDCGWFYRNRSSHDGLSGYCKECMNAVNKKIAARNPEKIKQFHKEYHFKKSYGITQEQFEEWANQIGWRCEICQKLCEHNGERRSLFVDHDHVSGRVRGLLCQYCNSALGHLFDDPEVLAAMTAYIRERVVR